MDSEKTTFTLKHPFVFKDVEFKEITLRRVKVADLKAVDSVKGDTEKVAKLTSIIAGIPVPAVDEIDGEDFAVISGHVARFLGVRPETGEKS